MNRDRRGVGAHWEGIAARFLGERGLEIVGRNYNCRLGELDIIALDGGTLVFIEVRFRRSRHYGSASESVEAHKQATILRAARHYLMRFPHLASHPIRFDVIAIDGNDERSPSLQWLQNAFDGT